MTAYLKRSLLPALLCLLLANSAFAIDEKYKSLPLDGSKGQVKKDSVCTVADTVFFNPALNATVLTTYSVQNVITFKINEYANRVLPDSFRVRVKFTIDFTNNLNQVVTRVDSLTIDYNKLRTYTNKAVYLQTGFHRSVLKIVTVTPLLGDSAVFLSSLMVENEIWITRDYQFNCSNNAVRTVNKDVATVATDGELKVFWSKERSADEYDLEWAYIDSTSIPNYYIPFTTTFDPLKIFDDNATRVTIKREDYKIPLLYDNGGILFYRVRPAQVKPNGQRSEASWSSDYTAQGGLGRYDFAGHERGMNWQSTTTYAEEGKRKSVVTYFDGSLRTRQTVTKDNSTNTTVVAESFYDFQGRAAVQVMPSPTLSTIIKYTPDFNPALNGAEYDKDRFDYELVNANDFCGRSAEALGTQSGASRYYSPANTEVNSGFNKFLPNANGFPFTETVFTQDNTGRVAKQSSAGVDFKIGSGHETQYFYGSADQEELDALFGTEVGNAGHYFKNMVRDPNGQYSVTYTDMRGRTIASALAGNSPTSLEALASNVGRTFTKKLIDSTNNQINGTRIESAKAMLVPKAGTQRFIYTLTPDSIRRATCTASNICYDCMYDLEIIISDDCNNKFNNGNPLRIARTNVQLNPADTVCNALVAFPQLDTTVFLPEGSYMVTKRLSISSPALEYYRDSVFMKKNTCKKLEDFIEEERQILRQQLLCFPNCQSCTDSLGTWAIFRDKFMTQLGISPQDSAAYRSQAELAYQRGQETCAELCLQTGLHNSTRQAMLLDMTAPFGQYADPENIDNFSIFFRPGTTSPYIFQQVSVPYMDADGKLDSVINSSGIKVPPTHSTISKEEFAENFKPTWAESLLPFHPEYCKLQKIEEAGFAQSYIWDERFEKTDSYQAAVDSGYLNPTANGSAPFNQFAFYASRRDPFFNPAVNPSYANTWRPVIEAKMVTPQSGTGINMWSLATAMTLCPGNDGPCFNTYASNGNAFNINVACTGDRDMAWRNFREMYLNEKRKVIDQILNGLPCNSNAIAVPPHNLNFPPFNATVAGAPQNAAQGRDSLNKFIEDNCKLYAAQWWSQLKPCSFTAADSVIVMPRLIQVCREGGDETHLFGSSTVKPSSTYKFRSFEAVLKNFADSAGRAWNTPTCNVYLITDPVPYEVTIPYGDVDTWTKPDTCQCTKINKIYAAYQANSQGQANFAAYVNARYKTTMTEADLQMLRSLCNNTTSCIYVATPITIPTALQCGADSSCISCTQMAVTYSQFLDDYPAAHRLSSNDTLAKQAYYKLFENYFNAKLGFRKQYWEYRDFMEDCRIPYFLPSTTSPINPGPLVLNPSTGGTVPGTLDCTALQGVVTQLNTAFPALTTWNYVTRRSMKTLYPTLEYFLNCNGGTTLGQTMNPQFWKGAGVRTSPTTWYRSNLTFLNFDVRLIPNKATVDSANLKMSPVLTDPFNPDINFSDMTTLWDSTLTCSQLSVSYFGFSVPTYTPMYTGTTALGNTVYTYNCKNQYLNYFKFPWFYRGNVLHSVLNPATTAANSQTFIGSSHPTALSDGGVKPRLEVWMRKDTLYHCKDLIAAFFNDKLNTNLSYDALATLYQQKCGVPLPYSCPAIATGSLCGRGPVFPVKYVEQYSPCDDSTSFAVVKGTIRYEAYRDSLARVFEEAYLAKCLAVAKTESLTLTQTTSEYHYTLYYYDQSGALVKTIPPEGVDMSKFATPETWSASVKLARKNNQLLTPAHTLATNFRYNTLGQVVAQNTPDAGLSNFFFDRLGRLVISQDAKQRTGAVENNRYYSYTRYDYLGRINEVGQIRNPSSGALAMTDAISRSETQLNSWITNNYTRIDNVNRTVYDLPNTSLAAQLNAQNLRNRVAYTTVTIGNSTTAYNQATYYSYDVHGNADTVLQDYGNSSVTAVQNVMNTNGNRWKKIIYGFDLVSGKVNDVKYQDGQKDQFFHRYEYDAENKLTNVYTSYDNIIWEQDARYEYYKHGPLARSLLGEQLVQGLDYTYTLQGWQKGLNSTSLNPDYDMGEDGRTAGQRRYIARDAFSYSLNYFTGDYSAINSSTPFPGASAFLGAAYRPLYNGNVSSMAVNLGRLTALGGTEKAPKLYNYSYDQLNRLTGMDAYNGLNETANNWNALSILQDYKERLAYDANGNITKYLRQGYGANLSMDSLTYNYTYSGGKLVNNRLNFVRDRINNSTAHTATYTEDINDQATGNYTYDALGNLVTDASESITAILWNVYGKITEIQRTATANNPVTNIQYTYDAVGNRISKRVAKTGTTTVEFTWYVRDAQGNTLGTYGSTGTGTTYSTYTLNLGEQHLYGSGRLGLIGRVGVNMKTAFAPGNYRSLVRGEKQYELGNHLGNVAATITDKKLPVLLNPTTVDYYTADVVTANDYYPFGMVMVGRKFAAGTGYRYGFNGYENDAEMNGAANSIDFGERIYNPRLGRFLSIDPLSNQFPGVSNYTFGLNNPILFVDENGESPISMFIKQAAKMGIKKAAKEFIEAQIKSRVKAYLSKGWAKQLMKDAEDALDILDTEWWEYIVEVIPVVGDAYGAASLGKKGYKLWKKLEEIERKAANAMQLEKKLEYLAKKTQTIRSVLNNTRDKLKATMKNAKEWAAKGFEAHHLIPVGIVDGNDFIQEAIMAGWDYNNGDLNGKWLPKGFHVNHPAYNEFVNAEISDWVQKFKEKNGGRIPSGAETADFLTKELSPKLRKKIDGAWEIWKKGGKKKDDNISRFFRGIMGKK